MQTRLSFSLLLSACLGACSPRHQVDASSSHAVAACAQGPIAACDRAPGYYSHPREGHADWEFYYGVLPPTAERDCLASNAPLAGARGAVWVTY